MMLLKRSCIVATTLLMGMAFTHQAVAAIALDRTRVIFNGAEKSISLNVSNQNKDLPYLAQGWMENENGERIESPLIVLPPIQRIEPGDKSQIKVQSLPDIAKFHKIEKVFSILTYVKFHHVVISLMYCKLHYKRGSNYFIVLHQSMPRKRI